ncbi:MAG: glycosyltransferase family 2 protein [Acidobacteria bacterium]|nr:glycosyltransferase family 2 protein [Acidobacteriota bacterium]MCG3194537.1 hypothetical protein [Thermoanaerobaculia bacterium]
MISVIIPVAAGLGNEPSSGPALPAGFVERINEPRDQREVLVAATAPASRGAAEIARAAGGRVIESKGPRGERLRTAAREARGQVLLFLHADTVLPSGWAAPIERAISNGAEGGAFRLGFDGAERSLKWVAFWANVRTAFTRVPYGDQAPFVLRDVYERLGGHAPWPLLEDVDFGRRLKRAGRVALLDAAVTTSGSRYRERGVFRNVFDNWKVLLRYHLGASPEELARVYRRQPGI